MQNLFTSSYGKYEVKPKLWIRVEHRFLGHDDNKNWTSRYISIKGRTRAEVLFSARKIRGKLSDSSNLISKNSNLILILLLQMFIQDEWVSNSDLSLSDTKVLDESKFLAFFQKSHWKSQSNLCLKPKNDYSLPALIYCQTPLNQSNKTKNYENKILFLV